MKLIKKCFVGSSLYYNDEEIYPELDYTGIVSPSYFVAPKKNQISNNYKDLDFSSIAKEAGKSSVFNNKNVNIALNFFLNAGLPLEKIAALIANAFFESGGFNDKMMTSNKTYKGAWQWNKLQEKDGHFSATDLNSQLSYLITDLARDWPLKGKKYSNGKPESHNGWNPKYRKMWEQGGTPALLATWLSLGYERGNPATDAKRASLATSVFNFLKNTL